jgi:hypothetical protein
VPERYTPVFESPEKLKVGDDARARRTPERQSRDDVGRVDVPAECAAEREADVVGADAVEAGVGVGVEAEPWCPGRAVRDDAVHTEDARDRAVEALAVDRRRDVGGRNRRRREEVVLVEAG